MTSDAALTEMNEMDTAGKTRDFEGLQVAAATRTAGLTKPAQN
jgi:hypothetical protein